MSTTNVSYQSIGERLNAAYEADGSAYSANFDAEWKAIAAESRDIFLQAQGAYTRKNYYDGAVNKLKAKYPDFDISNYSIALRDVFYSRAVHFGTDGFVNMMGYVFGTIGPFANQPEAELIRAIYAECSEVRDPKPTDKAWMQGTSAEVYGVAGKTLSWFHGSSSDVQLGVYMRLAINEPAEAQQMLADYGYTDAVLSEGIYQFSPADNADLAVLVSGDALLLNAPNPAADTHQFRLTYYASGYYTLTSVTTGLRLSADENGVVTLSEATAGNDQMWQLEHDEETGRYRVKNRASEQYLSADAMSAGGSVLTSADAALWQISHAASAWSLTGAAYPSYATGLQVGNSRFPFRGTLRCSYPITTVTVRILDAAGEDVMSPAKAENVNALSYDLSNLDSKVAFSRLGAGAYRLVISAVSTAPAGNTYTLSSDFYVSDGKYALRFDGCGGTPSEPERRLLAGQAYGTLPTAHKDGYIFTGWFTEPEGGTPVDSASTMSAQDQTVYAHYVKGYTYAFQNHDGVTLASGLLAEGDPIPAPGVTPTRPDNGLYYYTFLGWGGYSEGMTISEDVVFTAQYEEHKLELLPEMSTGSYTIRDGYLRAIAIGTPVSSLLENLVPNEYITIHKGSATATELAATGMTVEYAANGEVIQTLTVVVTGDVNGDGKISITDLVQINSHLLKKNELSGAAASAADVNADGKISITDLVQINSHLLKRNTVTPN